MTPEQIQIALRDAVKNVNVAILDVKRKANDRKQVEDTTVDNVGNWNCDYGDWAWPQMNVKNETSKWVGCVDAWCDAIDYSLVRLVDSNFNIQLPSPSTKITDIDNYTDALLCPIDLVWNGVDGKEWVADKLVRGKWVKNFTSVKSVKKAWLFAEGSRHFDLNSWETNRNLARDLTNDRNNATSIGRREKTMQEAEDEFNRASDGLIRAKDELVKAINNWIDANR